MALSGHVYLLGLLLATVFLHQPVLSEDCIREDGQPTCVCKTSTGIIDLTPLSRNASAMFQDIADPYGNTYSYNPCTVFTEGECKKAFICQNSQFDPQEHTLADGGEKIIGNANGTFYVNYTSSNNDLVRSIEVSLFCKQGYYPGDLIAIGDTIGAGAYRFELHSCYACPGGCKSETSGTSVVGIAGLVLIIIAILAVLIYFIVGAVIKKVHYHATGIDIIPNKDFWVLLPELIKDGCLCVVSPCRNLVRKDGYSAM